MDHDAYIQMTPAQWTKTQRWLINRILFLFHMKDKNPDRFYGGTIDDFELMYKRSFSPELGELQKHHPTLYAKANAIFMDDFPSDEVKYI